MGRVGIPFVITEFGSNRLSVGLGPVSNTAGIEGNCRILKTDGDNIIKVWQQVKTNSNLNNAITFMNMAQDYCWKPELAIFLLVTAFESIVLKEFEDDKYRGELRYRFSHRMAAFIGKDAAEKMKYFYFFRKAYDLRSAFAHGSPIDSNVIIKEREGEMALDAFFQELRSVFKLFVFKVLEEIDIIEWDEYLFRD